MITVSEARARILQWAAVNPPTRRPLLQAVGLVLAQDVISDIDSPPHDKSLVDGFAVRSADCVRAEAELEVIQCVTAGELPTVTVKSGQAVQIMTGAPLPQGADAVVMLEQTSDKHVSQAGSIRILEGNVVTGQNRMRRGAVVARGTAVLPAGHAVRAVDVGLLAEVGCSDVPVIEPPHVAVLATGNELVDAGQPPPPGMIRNSNGPLLCALAESLHAHTLDLGIASDEPHGLQQSIQQGLQQDVLVLSGGVSAGVLDLVPQVLQELGVQQVFHKVRLKPGKPMWFGVYPGRIPDGRKPDGRKSACLVFGMPGNPMGSLVCFELFVAPVLRTLSGLSSVVNPMRPARLAMSHHTQGDRPTYHPARAARTAAGSLVVTPLVWHGSSDQRVIAQANCLILFPPGERRFADGEEVDIVTLPNGGVPER